MAWGRAKETFATSEVITVHAARAQRALVPQPALCGRRTYTYVYMHAYTRVYTQMSIHRCRHKCPHTAHIHEQRHAYTDVYTHGFVP